jgi:hypothetical protein
MPSVSVVACANVSQTSITDTKQVHNNNNNNNNNSNIAQCITIKYHRHVSQTQTSITNTLNEGTAQSRLM